MPNHVLPGEALSFMQGNWNWTTATFYTNLVVGDPGATPYDSTWDVYDDVLAVSGLSEYTHGTYTANKPMFAMSASSNGQLVPTSSPGVISHVGLGANTAEGGANMRALALIRQVGGSPNSANDKVTCWFEDGISYDPNTGLLIAQNGGAPDFDLTWSGTVVPVTDFFDDYYDTGRADLLNGVFRWGADSAAGRLYMKLIVGDSSVAFSSSPSTANGVVAQAGLSEYVGTNYVPDVVLPPMEVVLLGSSVRVQPITRPYTQPYSNLWPNTAEGGANIYGALVVRQAVAGVFNGAADRPVVMLRNNISKDPDDGTVYRLNGTRKVMRFQWPSQFAGLRLP